MPNRDANLKGVYKLRNGLELVKAIAPDFTIVLILKVVNPITVGNIAFLFDCMRAGRIPDSLTILTLRLIYR